MENQNRPPNLYWFLGACVFITCLASGSCALKAASFLTYAKQTVKHGSWTSLHKKHTYTSFMNGVNFTKDLRIREVIHDLPPPLQLSPFFPPAPTPILLLTSSCPISCFLPINLSLFMQSSLATTVLFPPKPSRSLSRTKGLALARLPQSALGLSLATVLFITAIMNVSEVVTGERVREWLYLILPSFLMHSC